MREILDSEGLIVKDRFGQERAHPLVAPEVQTRTALARLLEMLGLSEEPEANARQSAAALARKRWGTR